MVDYDELRRQGMDYALRYELHDFAEAMNVIGCAAALRAGTPVPASYHIGSDSYPMTAVSVGGDQCRVIYARKDQLKGYALFVPDARPITGRIKDDPDLRKFTRRQSGRYQEAGRSGYLTLGRRTSYLDPSF